jgi:hypothetical protein
LHVAPAEIAPVPGLPLAIGMDAGLDPAAIIGQKLGNGHWLILDELVSEHGTGAGALRPAPQRIAVRALSRLARCAEPAGSEPSDWLGRVAWAAIAGRA